MKIQDSQLHGEPRRPLHHVDSSILPDFLHKKKIKLCTWNLKTSQEDKCPHVTGMMEASL